MLTVGPSKATADFERHSRANASPILIADPTSNEAPREQPAGNKADYIGAKYMSTKNIGEPRMAPLTVQPPTKSSPLQIQSLSAILDDGRFSSCYVPSTVWSISDLETGRNAKSRHAIESPKVLPVRECTGLL